MVYSLNAVYMSSQQSNSLTTVNMSSKHPNSMTACICLPNNRIHWRVYVFPAVKFTLTHLCLQQSNSAARSRVIRAPRTATIKKQRRPPAGNYLKKTRVKRKKKEG